MTPPAATNSNNMQDDEKTNVNSQENNNKDNKNNTLTRRNDCDDDDDEMDDDGMDDDEMDDDDEDEENYQNENDDAGRFENVVRLCEGPSFSSCGYCHGKRASLVQRTVQDSSGSYGMLGCRMSASTYQALLNRGWRRSGLHLYRPWNAASCCPQLTIRLDVARFKPTKSQRKVLSKLNRRLKQFNNDDDKDEDDDYDDDEENDKQSSLPAKNNNDNGSTSFMQRKRPRRGSSQKQKQQQQDQQQKANNENYNVKSSPQRLAVQESGILNQLEEWTKHALHQWSLQQKQKDDAQQVLATLFNKNNNNSNKKKKKPNQSCFFRIQAQTSSQHVQVISTLCAALEGISRRRYSKQEVATFLIQELQCRVGHQQQHNQSSSGTTLTIQSIQWNHNTNNLVVMLLVQMTQTSPTAIKNKLPAVAATATNNNKNDQPEKSKTETKTTSPTNQEQEQQDWIFKWARERNITIEPPYQMKITTMDASSSALIPDVHALYFDYQHDVHKDPHPLHLQTNKRGQQQQQNSNDNHKMQLDNHNDNDTNKKALMESLMQQYGPPHLDWGETTVEFQRAALEMLHQTYGHHYSQPSSRSSSAHKKDVFKSIVENYASFVHFLVENPFDPTTTRTPASTRTTTLHQHYRLNGVLIAVGVLDVLKPTCLSSVYAFYDATFARLICPLGKFLILKEIEYCQKVLRLPHYYLGYYIHSCPKMTYKADYGPSELLCPVTQTWVPAPLGRTILNRDATRHFYCQLHNVQEAPPQEQQRSHSTKSRQPPPPDIGNNLSNLELAIARNEIPLHVGGPLNQSITLGMLYPRAQEIVQPLLDQFIRHVGPDIAKQCLINFE